MLNKGQYKVYSKKGFSIKILNSSYTFSNSSNSTFSNRNNKVLIKSSFNKYKWEKLTNLIQAFQILISLSYNITLHPSQ